MTWVQWACPWLRWEHQTQPSHPALIYVRSLPLLFLPSTLLVNQRLENVVLIRSITSVRGRLKWCTIFKYTLPNDYRRYTHYKMQAKAFKKLSSLLMPPLRGHCAWPLQSYLIMNNQQLSSDTHDYVPLKSHTCGLLDGILKKVHMWFHGWEKL